MFDRRILNNTTPANIFVDFCICVMISLEIDIFDKFQGQGGEVIGTLKAAHVRHCGLKANEPGTDWWQPSDDR